LPTILVVDDEPAVRDLVALMLEHGGFSVLRAASGVDAIALSRSHEGEIDLLVTDLRMPEMDGFTLADTLQAETPGLPVLFISASYEARQAKPGNTLSMLAKPFSMEALLCVAFRVVGAAPNCACPLG